MSTGSSNPSILERLERGDVLISDGATGSYLQMNGLPDGGNPEEFNASHPEVVRSMAKAYFNAGSDMVLTNSFGGTRFRQKGYNCEDRVHEFNKLAAEHARSQAPEGRFVVGSVGPIGELLEPNGEAKPDDVYDAFVEQITALAEGGADAVDIETMFDIEESKLAIKAAKDHTDLIVMATMTFDKGPRGLFTMMGVTPEQAVKGLSEEGADIVGANCGNGIDVMVDLAKQMREVTDAYMLVHSNAGIPQYKGGEIVYPESPNYMVEGFMQLKDIGVNIIGGCCGTNPQHIQAFAKALRG